MSDTLTQIEALSRRLSVAAWRDSDGWEEDAAQALTLVPLLVAVARAADDLTVRLHRSGSLHTEVDEPLLALNQYVDVHLPEPPT